MSDFEKGSILDDHSSPASSHWPVAVKWGAISAALVAAYTLLGYILGWSGAEAQEAAGGGSFLMSLVWGAVLLIAYIFLYYKAIRQQAAKTQGFISFGKAYWVSLSTVIIKGLCLFFFFFLFYQFIAPDSLETIVDVMEQSMPENQEEEVTELVMGYMRWWLSPFPMGLLYLGYTLIGGAILSVVAAVVGSKG